MVRILDVAAPFNERQIKLMVDFADFLTNVDKELGKKP